MLLPIEETFQPRLWQGAFGWLISGLLSDVVRFDLGLREADGGVCVREGDVCRFASVRREEDDTSHPYTRQ